MEVKMNKSELTNVGKRQSWYIIWEQSYFLRIAFTIALGGLLYGYDSGINYNYLLSIRDEHECILEAENMEAILGLLFPSGIMLGVISFGHLSSLDGRLCPILISDVIFIIGAIIGAIAFNNWMVFSGRLVVGIGVGTTLFGSPIYVAEVSPHMIRGVLVSIIYLFVAGGQLLAYVISRTFSKVPGTWRWMLLLGGVLAMVQLYLMKSLPQSPKQIYRQNREEGIILLRSLYPSHEVEKEMESLESALKGQKYESFEVCLLAQQSFLDISSHIPALGRGYVAGIGCILAQQLVGINMVLYSSPTILQMSGYTTKNLNSLIIPGLSALGCLVTIFFVDRWGRRKLLLISILGIIVSLWMLSYSFYDATMQSSSITSELRNISFTSLMAPPDLGSNWTDLNLSWNGSTAYGGAAVKVGFLAEVSQSNRSSYHGEAHHNSDVFALIGLHLYIMFYSLGMGTVPWIINSEIYPFNFRLSCVALASILSLYSNCLSGVFLSIVSEALGFSNTFHLLYLVSCLVGLFVFLFVPETKGLRLEEIEIMLQEVRSYHSWKMPEAMNL